MNKRPTCAEVEARECHRKAASLRRLRIRIRRQGQGSPEGSAYRRYVAVGLEAADMRAELEDRLAKMYEALAENKDQT